MWNVLLNLRPLKTSFPGIVSSRSWFSPGGNASAGSDVLGQAKLASNEPPRTC